MVDLGEDEERFENFMMPLMNAFESTAQQFDAGGFPSADAKKTLIGLSRDLRGLAYAFNTKAVFMMFFDWM